MASPSVLPQSEGVQHTPGSVHVSCPSVGVGSGGDGILSEEDGGGGEGGSFIVDAGDGSGGGGG